MAGGVAGLTLDGDEPDEATGEAAGTTMIAGEEEEEDGADDAAGDGADTDFDGDDADEVAGVVAFTLPAAVPTASVLVSRRLVEAPEDGFALDVAAAPPLGPTPPGTRALPDPPRRSPRSPVEEFELPKFERLDGSAEALPLSASIARTPRPAIPAASRTPSGLRPTRLAGSRNHAGLLNDPPPLGTVAELPGELSSSADSRLASTACSDATSSRGKPSSATPNKVEGTSSIGPTGQSEVCS